MSSTTPFIPAEFVAQILKTVAGSVAHSSASLFWTVIKTLWVSYWPYILIFIFLWVVWELVTRNGGFHYNSENGFSPTFNRVVGAGFYALFQAGLYLVISKVFGTDSYSNMWPYPIHLVVFMFTGLFLNLVGFWKYWKLPRM